MADHKHDGLSLLTPNLTTFVNTHWSNHLGAIDGHDIQFLASLLSEAKPTTIVEIGCASGLSTGALALMMADCGPSTIHSFDLATNFYDDPDRPLGYLTADLDLPETVSVKLHPGKTSLDVKQALGDTQIDFCFIDGRHAHPWPTLDTLAVLPHMRPGAFIVHHDLKMYQDDRPDSYASGPKIVLDQSLEDMRVLFGSRVSGDRDQHMKARAFGSGNIFGLSVPDSTEELACSLSQGLYLPWDPLPETFMTPEFVSGFTGVLAAHYPAPICKALKIGLSRYNRPLLEPRPGFWQRVASRF